jgi:myosin tail region-interacting protein MTI1
MTMALTTIARPSAPAPMSPSAGSESDDEMSERPPTMSMATPTAEVPRAPPRPLEGLGSPKSPNAKRASYFGTDQASPISPITPGSTNNKRASRLPPPIPGASAPQPQNRAPPPPPPSAAPISRSNTGDQGPPPPPLRQAQEESDEEVTEYEGDYDTDIASTAPHKDALKAQNARESSLDDRSPVMSPSGAPPPLPQSAAPRAIPPPLPSQPPPNPRQSADVPRAAPPPPPPGKMPAPWEQDDDEYDPFKYTAAPKQSIPSAGGQTPRIEKPEEDLYSASPPRTFSSPPQQDRAVPQPPPRDAPPSGSRAAPRQSLDVSRSATNARRSVELGRMSMDSGFVANDVDLGPSSFWWTQPHGIPPVFQNRKDILLDFDESSSKRGSKTIVAKELYVLFQDYSQTVVTAQFDAQNPSDIKLEQRHEPPPSRLRQDQLEQAHEQFGRRISEAVTSRKETVVGDGTPQTLIQELLKPLTNALLPVGTRAYGAVVYGNLANASTQQNDEIRPGDIITLRNTKFQGKHGPMHAKYSMEVGKPDHVGVVAEWDGTKKKVRAWEQGRESKKVKLESFKLDDLRSGEVKIWRVMPRSWVGWSGQN